MADEYKVLPLVEIFEDDPKRCEKYNRIGRTLLEYMDLSEDKSRYYADDDKHCMVDFEELKLIVQCMEKTFENISANFKRVDKADAMSDGTVGTFLMNTYYRSEGGNEINDAFRRYDEIFDVIATINRALALIGIYTGRGDQIYIAYETVTKLHLDCQNAYTKYCSDMASLTVKDDAFGRQLRIISFLMDILKCIYEALKSFDMTVEIKRQCILTIVHW